MLTGNEHRVLSLVYERKTDLVEHMRALVRFKTVAPADDGRAEGDDYYGSLTDAIHLINYADIPTISIAPCGRTAHMGDVHVGIEEPAKTAQALALAIMGWCGVAGDSKRER